MAEEEQLLLALRDSLKKDFPNPGRTGCPPSEVLRALASGKARLNETRQWLAHLGSCSDCYQDFTSIQRQTAKHRRMKIFAAVAAVLLFSMTAALVLQKTTGRTEISVLDLRAHESLRGTDTESSSSGPPLTLKRSTAGIIVQLPLGSSEGIYELHILNASTHEVLLKTSATAHLVDHTTVLRISLASQLAPGKYVFEIRQENMGWSYYFVVVS